jgi:hypothetical protein
MGLDECAPGGDDFAVKRIPRRPERFEVLRAAEALAAAAGLSLRDDAQHGDLVAAFSDALGRMRPDDSLFYGTNSQAMFGHVAAALGHCRIIKDEDAGEVYAADDVVPPDYRIVTVDGNEFFVEVKNFFSPESDTYTISKSEVDGLRAYAAAFGRDLKIAIYWAAWGMWSLLPLEAFTLVGDRYSISFPVAMKRSEMKIIGDWWVGTKMPLRLRFFTNPTKPRRVGDDGRAQATIGDVKLYCGDTEIDDPLEKQIAWFIMMNYPWTNVEQPADIVDGELLGWEFVFRPEIERPEQGFELLAPVSQLISSQYRGATATEGEIRRILPDRDRSPFGVHVPKDYRGTSLPLWRFFMSPNADDDDDDDPRQS